MLKEKKRLIILFTILALILILVLGAKPLYNLYRDISFSWTDHSEAELAIKAFAEEKDISYGEYPQYIIDLLENNPETQDFVFNYPFRKKQAVDLSGYSRDTVPLFLQWDPMWGYQKYGSSIVAVTGCGPTCLAMAGYYLTGDENMTPDQVAKFAEKNGYYASGYGSSWTLISEGAEKLGWKPRSCLWSRRRLKPLWKKAPLLFSPWARATSPPPGTTLFSPGWRRMVFGSTIPTAV